MASFLGPAHNYAGGPNLWVRFPGSWNNPCHSGIPRPIRPLAALIIGSVYLGIADTRGHIYRVESQPFRNLGSKRAAQVSFRGVTGCHAAFKPGPNDTRGDRALKVQSHRWTTRISRLQVHVGSFAHISSVFAQKGPELKATRTRNLGSFEQQKRQEAVVVAVRPRTWEVWAGNRDRGYCF